MARLFQHDYVRPRKGKLGPGCSQTLGILLFLLGFQFCCSGITAVFVRHHVILLCLFDRDRSELCRDWSELTTLQILVTNFIMVERIHRFISTFALHW